MGITLQGNYLLHQTEFRVAELSHSLIRNASIHTGKTKEGRDFADVYRSFDTEVVEAFGEFLSIAQGKPKCSSSVQV